GHGLAPDQVAALERPQKLAEALATRTHLAQHAAPEDLAPDRRVEQDRALGVRERVEPRGEEAPDRVRQRARRRRRRLGERRGELLDEERVARRRSGELGRALLARRIRVLREAL